MVQYTYVQVYVENEYFNAQIQKIIILHFLLFSFLYLVTVCIFWNYVLLYFTVAFLYYTHVHSIKNIHPLKIHYLKWANSHFQVSWIFSELSKIRLSFCYSSWFSTRGVNDRFMIIVYLCCILFSPFSQSSSSATTISHTNYRVYHLHWYPISDFSILIEPSRWFQWESQPSN